MFILVLKLYYLTSRVKQQGAYPYQIICILKPILKYLKCTFSI